MPEVDAGSGRGPLHKALFAGRYADSGVGRRALRWMRRRKTRGPVALVRRTVLAVAVAVGALAAGILLAYGWQDVAGPRTVGSAGSSAATIPSIPHATARVAGAGRGVPAGWVGVDDVGRRLRSGHPVGWSRRADRLITYYVQPAPGGGLGVEEVGAGRLVGRDPRQVLLTFQAQEMRGLPDLRRERLEEVGDVRGLPAAELVASYLRKDVRARVVARAISTANGTYVLVARAAAVDPVHTDTLLQQLVGTFRPL